MNIAKKILVLLFLGLMLLPSGILATVTPPADPGGGPDATISDVTEVWTLIIAVRNWLFAILGVVVVIMLGVAAFQFITASGNDEKIGNARKMVTYALIGVAVMLLAGGVIALVESFITLGN